MEKVSDAGSNANNSLKIPPGAPILISIRASLGKPELAASELDL
jgi:hypothetical protein